MQQARPGKVWLGSSFSEWTTSCTSQPCVLTVLKADSRPGHTSNNLASSLRAVCSLRPARLHPEYCAHSQAPQYAKACWMEDDQGVGAQNSGRVWYTDCTRKGWESLVCSSWKRRASGRNLTAVFKHIREI